MTTYGWIIDDMIKRNASNSYGCHLDLYDGVYTLTDLYTGYVLATKKVGETPKTTAKISRYAITTIKGVSILWGYMPWGICPLKYGTVAECMKARYERRCYE